MRLKRNRSEGLLILGKVLAEHVPQSFGLLRAEVDAMMIFDVDLVGGVLMSDAEIEEEIPDAYAHLNAVGIGFAIIRGLAELDLGLGMAGVHGAYRV